MATLTVYPNPGVTTDGGMAGNTGSDLTWAQVIARTGDAHDDTTDRFNDGINLGVIVLQAGSASNTWLELGRSIALFDTSALTASATISAAILSLFGSAKADGNAATPNINVYTATPASNTALANGDYSQIGTVAQCDTALTYAGWSTSAYNDFTFNATGIGNISKTGISKFGFRNANYDVAAVGPPWVQFTNTNLGAFSSDKTGTANDPMLVITYTVPGGAVSNNLLLMGVG